MDNTRKSGFCPLMAVLAQFTAAMGVFWMVIALFGGSETAAQFDLAPPPVMWAAMMVCFAALHWILKKGRPLLLVLGACLLVTAAVSLSMKAFFQVESPVMAWLYGAGLLFGLFFQARWEVGRFKDETLILQLQLLLLLGICQLWLAGQLHISSGWITAVFAAAAVVLCGVAVSKASGIKTEGGRKTGMTGRRTGMIAAVLALCAMVGVFAAALAKPIGNAMAAVYSHTEGGLLWLLNGVGKVLGFLFSGNRVRVDETVQSGAEIGGIDGGAMAAGSGGGGDVFHILLRVVLIAMLAVLVTMFLRFFLQTTIGAGRAMVQKRGSRIERDGTLWQRMAAFVCEVRQQLRAREILRRNPDSVAALLVWLEIRCRRNPDLQRRSGETVRGFLTRLADQLDIQAEEPQASQLGAQAEESQTGQLDGPAEDQGSHISSRKPDDLFQALYHLADAADAACYSQKGNWLAAFPESDTIRNGVESMTSLK